MPYFPDEDLDRWNADYQDAVDLLVDGLAADHGVRPFPDAAAVLDELGARVRASPWTTDPDRCWLVLMFSETPWAAIDLHSVFARGPRVDLDGLAHEDQILAGMATTAFQMDALTEIDARPWFQLMQEVENGEDD